MKNRLQSGIVMNRRGLMFKLNRTDLRQFIILFLPLLLLIYAATAQSGAGDITGTVEDQSGLPVRGRRFLFTVQTRTTDPSVRGFISVG